MIPKSWNRIESYDLYFHQIRTVENCLDVVLPVANVDLSHSIYGVWMSKQCWESVDPSRRPAKSIHLVPFSQTIPETSQWCLRLLLNAEYNEKEIMELVTEKSCVVYYMQFYYECALTGMDGPAVFFVAQIK